MIPPREEILASIRGALLLVQRDPGGMRLFNVSLDGFWRSFFAAVLAAPIYLVLLSQRQRPSEAPLALVAFGETLAYVLSWLALPLAAIVLVRVFDLGRRYVPLVVAANWAALVQATIFLAAVLIAGLFGGGAGAVVLLAATIGVLVYEWYVVKVALEAPGPVAAVFVAADWVLGLLANAIGTGLSGG